MNKKEIRDLAGELGLKFKLVKACLIKHTRTWSISELRGILDGSLFDGKTLYWRGDPYHITETLCNDMSSHHVYVMGVDAAGKTKNIRVEKSTGVSFNFNAIWDVKSSHIV